MIDGDAVLDDDTEDEDLDEDADQEDDDDEAGAEEPAPGSTGRRRLDCKLTDAEIATTARQMAALELDIERTEDLKREAVKAYADELKEKRARARELARGVREGVIKRMVDIREEVHNLNMVTVRLDTGETIDSRPLTEEERQQAFAGMTAPEKAEAMPAAPEPEPGVPPDGVVDLMGAIKGALAQPVPVVPPLVERVRAYLADYAEGQTVKDIAKATGARETAVGDALEQLFVLGRAVRPPTSRHKKWTPGKLARQPVPAEGAP